MISCDNLSRIVCKANGWPGQEITPKRKTNWSSCNEKAIFLEFQILYASDIDLAHNLIWTEPKTLMKTYLSTKDSVENFPPTAVLK